MKKRVSILMFLIPLMLLTGCDALTGEEVARLSINEVTTTTNLISKEASLDLKKGEKIAIWSDMDFEYEGDVSLNFRIEVFNNGESMGILEVDPTDKNITIGEIKTTLMNKTSWSFSGKSSSITIKNDGNYNFKAILVASANPTLKINKAEVVLKK